MTAAGGPTGPEEDAGSGDTSGAENDAHEESGLDLALHAETAYHSESGVLGRV